MTWRDDHVIDVRFVVSTMLLLNVFVTIGAYLIEIFLHVIHTKMQNSVDMYRMICLIWW